MRDRIVLAHARDAAAIAGKATARLKRLGFKVEPVAIKRVLGAARRAKRVVLLWSPGATSAKALIRHPQLATKLTLGRLGSGPRPPSIGAPVIRVSARRAEAWRVLINAEENEMKQSHTEIMPAIDRGARWEGFLAALLMAIVVASASYAAIPAFAQSVDAAVVSVVG